MTFASMADEFAANNCALLGLSVDSNPSHIEWCRAMERYQWKNIKNPKITFPIVADDLGKVATLYGMLMPTASATRTVRTVFVIDPDGIIRAMLAYPLTTGRNIREIMRLLLALQAYDKTGYSTPANWEPGQPQLLPVPNTKAEAAKRMENQDGESCLDWYICFTKSSAQENAKSQKPNSGGYNDAVMAASHGIKSISDLMEMMGASNAIGKPSANAENSHEIIPNLQAKAVKPDNPDNIPKSNDKASPIQYNVADLIKDMQPNAKTPPMQEILPNIQSNAKQSPIQSNIAGLMQKAGADKKAANTRGGSNKQEKAEKPKSRGGGIMEQNRLMFNLNADQKERGDYMITRDYPNFGA